MLASAAPIGATIIWACLQAITWSEKVSDAGSIISKPSACQKTFDEMPICYPSYIPTRSTAR